MVGRMSVLEEIGMRKLKGFGAQKLTAAEAVAHLSRYFRKRMVIAVERALRVWK